MPIFRFKVETITGKKLAKRIEAFWESEGYFVERIKLGTWNHKPRYRLTVSIAQGVKV